jgi:hypothetical protein
MSYGSRLWKYGALLSVALLAGGCSEHISDQQTALERMRELRAVLTPAAPSVTEPIRMINLSNTRVVDEDLELLRAFPGLQAVSLRGTSVSDEGIEQLASLSLLRRVDLGETRITSRGMRRLRELNYRINIQR